MRDPVLNAHDPLIAEVGKVHVAYAIAKAEANSND